MINPNEKEYLESFGLESKENQFVVKDKEKLKNAYNKAWENRDFEITKFWTRAAYFWGFLVLIFGAYFSNSSAMSTEETDYTKFYIICIGIIFSFAWRYVIKGSKRWQENWEIHITKLEDYVSGPLYKTIFTKGKTFYSVSKINELLSLLIIIVWGVFLIEYCIKHFCVVGISKSDIRILLGILTTSFFIYQIIGRKGKSEVSQKKLKP